VPAGQKPAGTFSFDQGKTNEQMRSVRAVTFALALALSTTSIAADKAADVTDMQALRNAVRADKKAYVASVLNLTPDEARNSGRPTTPTSGRST
jgi:hypothetical protein